MKDQVAIVTGATSMIGRATASVFSKQGMKLMLVGRDLDKLEELADQLPGAVEISVVDNRSEEQILAMVKKTVQSFHRIDAVVQNVSIYPWKRIDELSLEEWKNAIDINLTGSFLTTKACFPEMQKKRSGKFLFISSIAGELMGLPLMGAYAASKAGLNGFMRTAAIEFSKDNINVNCISPGKIYDESTLSEQEIREKLRAVPLQRFIQPIDIAEMALFLISEKAKNITGQNFVVDGGQSVLGEDSHIASYLS